MRYFTRNWYYGELGDDFDYEQPGRDYQQHLLMVEERLPAELRRFLTAVNIHDGRFQRFRHDVELGELHVGLLGNVVQEAPLAINLRFEEASLVGADAQVIAQIAAAPATELLYDEVDCLLDGTLEWRLAVWASSQYETFAVRFTRFGYWC